MVNNDILMFLHDKFPEHIACPWDNVGLLVGSKNSAVKSFMVCLDITKEVFIDAVKQRVDLIITHHPIIFNGVKSVNSDDLLYKLIQNGISVISLHTNLDAGEEGMNFQLCKIFGLTDIKALRHSDKEEPIIRYGVISTIYSDDFLKIVKQKLNSSCLKSSKCNKKLSTVAFCGGSGSGFIPLVKNAGIDAYITSEIKHDKFIYANENDILVIDAGHYETENIIVNYLENILTRKFPNIKLVKLKGDLNPVFYT